MDPYEVLGVSPSASEVEISRAFRRLVLLHHPDRNGGSEASAERLRCVKQAYDALRARPRPARVGYTSRDVEPANVTRVRTRLHSLAAAIRTAIAAPSHATLEEVIDRARWTRLDVDMALAFKKHVTDVRDASWSERCFVDAAQAHETFAAFLDAPIRGLDVVELRNLRARLDGLLAVTRGFQATLRKRHPS